uniref:Clathrin/coatomer adaptor adaptin-like N-terminal domain-containing protein n=1 Tax=Rhizophora mucronata TaxID=61149 RepID=A0A2P2MR77_RHIMU
MYTVVGDIFKKCDLSSNIGNAVLYECICCVSSIYPNLKLLEAAADIIARFLKSDSHNLKYMGIDALGRLISRPEIAEQHQLAVIDCLEDPDDTLKRKTFELLYKMTKSSNVEVIVDRMIDYMISISDNHYKTETASRCIELAEQFAPGNQWFIQTMNKVFEHAGDLVNSKVAHNLMRLIAEGIGEDDDCTDVQLRSSAVESYLRIIGEPKLPSLFLQVICWVLGEYGTADGKFSTSYISGKLCDVAEAYSNDETVKAYAVTALMKIYAFEIAAGRKVDLLTECQSLIEELSASHSTDLQQRVYELQAVVGLDAQTVKCIMPPDASCEDIEIDKNLSFLNGYVQQSLEKGAQPYIRDNERPGMLNISNFGNQYQPEASTAHVLRFEAYEHPKPAVPSTSPPVPLASSSEFIPVPSPSYYSETQKVASVSSSSDPGSSELKLRLDGVQKKWGRPTYSSPLTSTSNSNLQKIGNAITQDGVSTGNPKAYETSNESKRSQVEISPEKQKLAATLFGGTTSKPERRASSANQRVAKTSSQAATKATVASTAENPVSRTTPVAPPPDLLDLGGAASTSEAQTMDPFKQLEGLLDPVQDTASVGRNAITANEVPDIMALYEKTLGGGQSGGAGYASSTNRDDASIISTLSSATIDTAMQPVQHTKGPNPKDSLEKDAFVRQIGVTPSSENPILFRDLLG